MASYFDECQGAAVRSLRSKGLKEHCRENDLARWEDAVVEAAASL